MFLARPVLQETATHVPLSLWTCGAHPALQGMKPWPTTAPAGPLCSHPRDGPGTRAQLFTSHRRAPGGGETFPGFLRMASRGVNWKPPSHPRLAESSSFLRVGSNAIFLLHKATPNVEVVGCQAGEARSRGWVPSPGAMSLAHAVLPEMHSSPATPASPENGP